MKKTEVAQILQSLKYRKTDCLKKMLSQLAEIEPERSRTRAMYWWTDFGNASARRGFERRYNLELTIKITSQVVVEYWRRVNPSRKNAYAEDGLSISISGAEQNATVADINKLIAGIEAILERRTDRENKQQ